MLTKKQNHFYEIIINYYKKNHTLPNINTIKKITNYKSYNSLHKYLNILEKNNYLKYNHEKKEISYLKGMINNNHILKIPYIDQEKYFQIEDSLLKKDEDYYIFKVADNNLNNLGINKNNLVIIEKSKIYANNDIVLIKQKNKYHLYKCQKKDEFIRLINDIKSINIITTNILIGKVVLIIKSSI